MIHKEGGCEKEEEGSKGDDDGGENGGNNYAGEGEEREGDSSMEDASNYGEMYSVITSGQGTTTKSKDNTNDDDKEGRMVGIHQFWVCTMGHMESVSELITDRNIYCVNNLTNVTCRYFEDGTGF